MTDRNVVIRLRGDITDFQSKMRQAGLSAKNTLGRELDSVAKGKGAALGQIGDQAGRIGLIAAAGFGVAAMATANFDQAMSHVAATGEDARANIEELRAAALKAGADTAFSATEAAGGLEALGKAGVSTKDALSGGLTGALDLAAAGNLGVADSADVAATAMNQFKLTGADIPHIADLLAAAAGKAQGEVSDMAFALKQSGLVANQTGLSIEETSGALAAFASQGLLGSDAGTSFKQMLGSLTPNSERAAKVMEELGISAFNAEGSFVGLTKFAGNLRKSMKNLTDEQRAAKLETIFGSDAVRAATVLYDQGAKGIQKWITAVDDQGFAAETAATKMDNLKGDLEKLRGSIETLFISSGEGSQNFFRSLTQGAEGGVDALNGLPAPLKSTALAMLGITAITGGGLWFGSKTVRAVADTRKALRDLDLQARITRGSLVKAGLVVGGLAVANSELAEKTGLSNTASLAMMGTIAGPWGSAIGGGIGLVKDFASANNGVEDAVRAVDAAIESNSLAALNAGYEALIKRANELSRSSSFTQFFALLSGADRELLRQADVLQEHIDTLKNSSGDVSDALSGPLSSGVGRTKEAFQIASQSVEDFEDALKSLNDVLSGRADKRAFEASLDDALAIFSKRSDLQAKLAEAKRDLATATTDSGRDSAADRIADLNEQLKQLNVTLDIGKEAGRENQANLDAIAASALKVAEDLKKGGQDPTQFLDRARREFIRVGVQLGLTNGQAGALATTLGLIERTKAVPGVEIRGMTKAQRQADDLFAKLDALGGPGAGGYTATIIVDADTKPARDALAALRKLLTGNGGGSPETKPGASSLGELMGGPTTAERGAPSASQFSPRAAPATPGLSPADLASALSTGRSAPVIGQATIQPHNYSEFMAQMAAKKALVSAGGEDF